MAAKPIISVIIAAVQALHQRLAEILEWALLLLLAASVLWRGGKGLEATWLLAGLAVLLTFARWRYCNRKHAQAVRSVPPDLWCGLMLFLLWTIVSYALSKTRNYGLDEVIRDSALVLIFLWCAGASDRMPYDRLSRRLIAAIAVTALVACATGIGVYVLQPVNRMVGTFFDMRFHTDYWPNAWAEFLILAWPVMVLWSGKFRLPVRSATLGIVCGSLFLSYSRGAFLVFCGQIILWALIAGMRSWNNRVWTDCYRLIDYRRVIFAGISALIIGALLFMSVNVVRSRFHDVESVAAKATFTASEGSSSISERRDFWKQSFVLSLNRPLFGWGPYSFRFIQPRLQQDVFATSDHPHNILLKLAMERGWPAALLFLFVMLRILFPSAIASVRRMSASNSTVSGKDDDDFYLQTALLVAVSGVLAHNLIDYNLQFVGIALPLWLLLAWLAQAPSCNASLNAVRSFYKKNKKCIRIFEVSAAIILGIITILEGRFLILSSLGRRAEAAGDVAAAIQWYDSASGALFSRDIHLSRANLLFQRNDPAANAALDDYASANDEDARLWILRGRFAYSRGDAEEALRDYSIAMEMGKYNYLEPLEGILAILANGAHAEIAEAQESSFLAILRSFGDAILKNSHFIALSGSVESFDRTSALLRKIYPAQSESIKIYAEDVLAHAEKERMKYDSRRPGLLW